MLPESVSGCSRNMHQSAYLSASTSPSNITSRLCTRHSFPVRTSTPGEGLPLRELLCFKTLRPFLPKYRNRHIKLKGGKPPFLLELRYRYSQGTKTEKTVFLFSEIICRILGSSCNHSIPTHNALIVHFRLFHYFSPFSGNSTTITT